MEKLRLKLKECISSVLPIAIIVLLLHFTAAPMPPGILALFLVGTLLLIMGMGLFTLGADIAMMPMGEQIGAQLTKSRRLLLLIGCCFLIGVLITVAEPDLSVLATQVASVPNPVLILSVALGVGIFLVISLLRVIFQWKLAWLLILFYAIVFLMATRTAPDYLAVAFDSGGVTTGPITVPFILALGIGLSSVRGGKSSHDDSFGLVALCSIGPIMAVMIMGLFFDPSSTAEAAEEQALVTNTAEALQAIGTGLIHYSREVAIALTPIVLFFIVFQLAALRLPKAQLIKLAVGVLYTYLGLIIFLTGVNIGFLPAGNYLGAVIGSSPHNWILIPLGMVMGFFIVAAEPAVHVLNNQVESITGGSISKSAMLIALSVGVAFSIGFAMLRILTGLSIWYLLVPGYAIALILTFFTPPIFTGIAFDSGGVASGPMTATFLLPFAMGACESVGGNPMTDAFGIVAMVAMTPLIAIQVMGLIFRLKLAITERQESRNLAFDVAVEAAKAQILADIHADNYFIDLESEQDAFTLGLLMDYARPDYRSDSI